MGKSDAAMRRIRLEEARAKGAPAATGAGGYEFVAPLDEGGRIHLETWKKERALCFVHRLERGAVVEHGLLVHRSGGAGGSTWAFDYAPGTTDDEEQGYRFGSHAFTPGEYVSVRDEDGEMRTYRVATVTDA
ncbi:MAG: hypothetical protein JWN93_3421 [Hyphomicrobiales bacterium]|jgi:hypothetical protein|nr:hypothetical protein [Hyphomicrobiales bacterium]